MQHAYQRIPAHIVTHIKKREKPSTETIRMTSEWRDYTYGNVESRLDSWRISDAYQTGVKIDPSVVSGFKCPDPCQ